MKITKVKIGSVKLNPNNPRTIKDDKFKKLVKSIQEFPEMLKIRPIAVNKDLEVLGGNMRLRACQEAGLKEVYIIDAGDLTPHQQREFIIKDNLSFGEWDWDILANEWDSLELGEWGLDVWQAPSEVDYSILDEEDTELNEKINEMSEGVKKAIQIEFNSEHYDEAFELVKFWREQKLYIGGFLMEKLKEEKNKLNGVH
jgi:hypothetical protein